MIWTLLGLLPVLVVVGLGVLIARAVRGDDAEVDWGGLVLDAFQNLTTMVLAFTGTWGLAQLLEVALDGPGLVRIDEALAEPVTFTVVGLPLFAAALWWVLRRVREDRHRRESLAWAAHLGIVEIVALVVAMVATWDLARYLLEGPLDAGDGWAGPTARLVVWGALWALYHVLGGRYGGRRWAIIHVLVGSAIGLGTLATGLGQLLESLVERLLFGEALVVDDGATRPLVLVVLGAVVWIVYWLADGVTRDRDRWWYGWVLLGPVLTGLLWAVSALGYVVFVVAVWFLGEPTGGFVEHFEEVPVALAVAIVAAAAWFVHRSLLVSRDERPRTELDRIHDLVLAGVGLLAAAGGVAAILVAIIEATVGPGTAGVGDEPVNTLLGAVTFIAIGGPIWWRSWQRMQRLARLAPRDADRAVVDDTDPGRAERHSPSRRIYLFALFGVGGLVAVVTVLGGIVGFMEDLFAGDLGRETLRDGRFALATIVVVGAVAAYHWMVWRRDVAQGEQDPTITAGRRYPRRVTLVGVADDAIVKTLSAATGGRVELLERGDVVTPPWDLDGLTTDLADRDVDHVMVVADHTGPEVIPIRD